MAIESLLWVQSLIDNCSNNHRDCPNTAETTLPTRILHITPLANGLFDIRLKETNGERGSYACLSHRWGGSEKAITTRQSYANMITGISWNDIPRTFQDAISFVHSMGISNLWIDSYCIIQDDKSDWLRESEKMASTFQSSYITIAATVAKDNEQGLFWTRDDHYERFFEVDGLTTSEPINPVRFSVRRVMQHWERVWSSNNEDRFPLLTRAWVFQERILAPRVLHFSHLELVWECRNDGACQCGNYDSRSNAKTMSWTLNNSWRRAVELYTTLRLTRERDRLSALHGFATFYAPVIVASVERDYFAGLWRDSLRLDLLWRVDSLISTSSNPRRLCRCWDSELVRWSSLREEDQETPELTQVTLSKTRRCQYSYTAACSTTCLSERRLCRYGKGLAAIRYNTPIAGLSCVDWRREKTTGKELYEHERDHPWITEAPKDLDEGPSAPSWSWVSARSRVEYWDDLSTFWNNDQFICQIEHIKNKSGIQGIRGGGILLPALLQYGERLDRNSELMESEHEIHSYSVKVSLQTGSTDFGISPDDLLCLEGTNYIPDQTLVFLFHVGHNVYLVLKEWWFFQIPSHRRVYSRSKMNDNLRTEFVQRAEGRFPEKKQDAAKPGESSRRPSSNQDQPPDQEKEQDPEKPGESSHQPPAKRGQSPDKPPPPGRTSPSPRENLNRILETLRSKPNDYSHQLSPNDSQAQPNPDNSPALAHGQQQQRRMPSYGLLRPTQPAAKEPFQFHRIGILRIPGSRNNVVHARHHWFDDIVIT
jgi:hypothetical protein